MMKPHRLLLAMLWLGALLLSPPSAAQSDPPPDLRGMWRMDLYVVSHAQIPVLGTTTILAHTIMTARIDGTADAQVMHTTPCSLSPQTTRPIATTIVPQRFVDHLPRKDIPVQFERTAAGQWSLTADMQPQDVGWRRDRFTTTAGELLPPAATHPAVVDFEGDGHPGATLILDAPLFGEIEIYVVQTAHTVLTASINDAQVIDGTATPARFGQRTIGASNRLFVSNPTITLDGNQSQFRLARVPDNTSCAALSAGTGAGQILRPEDVRPQP